MFSITKTSKLAAVALAATCLASPAAAATFLFTFDDQGANDLDVTGTLTTEDVPQAGGGFLITGISGSADGFGGIALIPPSGFAGNDNLLFPGSDPLLSGSGFSFSAGGLLGNIFYSSDLSTYLLFGSANDTTGLLGFGTFSITPVTDPGVPAVPEPGTWALMLLGFGFVGAAMRRQRRANVTVSYA